MCNGSTEFAEVYTTQQSMVLDRTFLFVGSAGKQIDVAWLPLSVYGVLLQC